MIWILGLVYIVACAAAIYSAVKARQVVRILEEKLRDTEGRSG